VTVPIALSRAAEVLGMGILAITESRRLRALTREAREIARRPRRVLARVIATPGSADALTRRRLRAVARGLRRRSVAAS
jgi:hypothetical protein